MTVKSSGAWRRVLACCVACGAAAGCGVAGRWYVHWVEPSSLASAIPWRVLDLEADGRYSAAPARPSDSRSDGTWAFEHGRLVLRGCGGAVETYRTCLVDSGERLKLYRELDGSDLVVVLKRRAAPSAQHE